MKSCTERYLWHWQCAPGRHHQCRCLILQNHAKSIYSVMPFHFIRTYTGCMYACCVTWVQHTQCQARSATGSDLGICLRDKSIFRSLFSLSIFPYPRSRLTLKIQLRHNLNVVGITSATLAMFLQYFIIHGRPG